jgi:hypothetical protein
MQIGKKKNDHVLALYGAIYNFKCEDFGFSFS